MFFFLVGILLETTQMKSFLRPGHLAHSWVHCWLPWQLLFIYFRSRSRTELD